jgi:hypothetical protein
VKPFLKALCGGFCLVFIAGTLLAIVLKPDAVAGCLLGAFSFGGLRALLAVDRLF